MENIVRHIQYYIKKKRSEATVKASERNECILTERCFKRYYNRNAPAMIQTVDFIFEMSAMDFTSTEPF